MTQIAFIDAFDRPFSVRVVDDEITAQSDQAPVELVFTPASARETAQRLLLAADEAEAGTDKAATHTGNKL